MIKMLHTILVTAVKVSSWCLALWTAPVSFVSFDSHRDRLAPNISSSVLSYKESEDSVVEVSKALFPLLRLCSHRTHKLILHLINNNFYISFIIFFGNQWTTQYRHGSETKKSSTTHSEDESKTSKKN